MRKTYNLFILDYKLNNNETQHFYIYLEIKNL